jgi:predicted nuclease of predicted toxin-antitoxin system
MKFKFDENLGVIGCEILRASGHDVMTVADQKLSGADDRRIFEVCRDEARALVTLDLDFGHSALFPPEKAAGIILLICRGPMSPEAIRRRIAELSKVLESDSPEGRLWIVEPGRVRIREAKSL